MKDNRLENEFEEYFNGLNTPDNITADAKKYVKSKRTSFPLFVKFASIAASFVLVLAVSLIVVFSTRSPAPADDMPPQGVQYQTYEEADLTFEQADAYGIMQLNSSLKFIQTIAYRGASVSQCSAGYKDGELALVKAEVSLISGLSRHDTDIYVDFTEENLVYSPLEDYANGTANSYRGIVYYLTRGETAENGEPVIKLHFTYNGVKYYFYIASTDYNSHLRYLEIIVK